MDKAIGCVIIPLHEQFLPVLVTRREEFTSLIWPGHNNKANRMASPYKWFTVGPSTSEQKRQSPQKAIPFFFRSVGSEGPPYKASHLGLAVYMVHDDIYAGNSKIREAIQSLRVEKFSKDHWGDEGVRTWYVMANTVELDTPIPYDDLWLVKQDRPLSPNFVRGYGMVWLPKKLQDWYRACIEKHSQFLEHPIIKRWQYLQS